MLKPLIVCRQLIADRGREGTAKVKRTNGATQPGEGQGPPVQPSLRESPAYRSGDDDNSQREHTAAPVHEEEGQSL